MIFERTIKSELEQLATEYPIVTITGPRQAGKTLLSKTTFPNKAYASLEDPEVRELAEIDPRQFLANYPDGAIFDEIQRVPSLLSYLQVITDEQKVMGQYILTGSHQLELQQAITQSLAGRTALLHLLPLSIAELKASNIELSLNQYLLSGLFPAIHARHMDASKYYSNYLKTYIEKDVRQLINIKELSLFQRVMRLMASRIGQLFNAESFANDLGVSGHTVKSWVSTLEASFLVFRLTPYFENFGKRIIKSPKFYFTDPGLACYLLSIENLDQVDRDPLRGALVENLVILELYKKRYNQGRDPNLYFYRDQHHNEVDVIYQSGNALIPIEIKSAATYHHRFTRMLTKFKSIAEERCQNGYVVYTGAQQQQIDWIELLNFKDTEQIVA